MLSSYLYQLTKTYVCLQIAQLRTLLNVMNDIVRKCDNNALGMVMGDFNSTPQSAVYQFIKAGELDCQAVPRKHVSGQVEGDSWPAALENVSIFLLSVVLLLNSVFLLVLHLSDTFSESKLWSS